MNLKFEMKGGVNGHYFEIEGEGKGNHDELFHTELIKTTLQLSGKGLILKYQ